MNLQQYVDQLEGSVELQDLNDSDREFDASAVQVVVWLENVGGLTYQVSNTHDYGKISSRLKLERFCGSYEILEKDMLKHFDAEFVEERIDEAEKLIAENFNVQSEYDEYMVSLGHWEQADNCMDANSEVFVANES